MENASTFSEKAYALLPLWRRRLFPPAMTPVVPAALPPRAILRESQPHCGLASACAAAAAESG